MRSWAAGVVGGALALVLAIPAAYGGDQESRRSPSRTADEWIATQIQAQYFQDPVIKARTIVVTALNGSVTLEGHVNTPDERDRALQIAQGISGVRSVVSHLTAGAEPRPAGTSGELQPFPVPGDRADDLSPQAPGEGAILADVRSSLAADPVLSVLDIDVQVERGVVRLSGDVPDLAARTRAERLARAVRGVAEVRNGLAVKR